MSGIYIHIPFCKQDCHYCNFYFTLSREREGAFVEAICQEIRIAGSLWGGEEWNTLYWGGGTPSLLSVHSTEKILTALHRHFDLSAINEYTLEANPDDVNAEKISFWKGLGVNRLSMGVQSFFTEHLQYMNRIHDGQTAKDSIRKALDGGIRSLNIDLIYGVPGMTDEQWIDNLQTASQLGPDHLSCYALTVEPGTRLAQQIKSGRTEPVSEEAAARHLELLLDVAPTLGFIPYEISNLAKPGHEAKHNQQYWQYKPYLGLGPSAHSFDGKNRSHTVANLKQYIQELQQGVRPCSIEILTPDQQFNEYVMVRLRTRMGCSITEIDQRFGPAYRDHFKQILQQINPDFFQVQDNVVSLTNRGCLLADRITLDFLIV